MSKPGDVRAAAKSQLGSPYVYGAWGQLCTPALRKKYARLTPSQKEKTYNRCQMLRSKDPKPNCDGCKYKGDRAFDCRGFTHWCLKEAGIDITGDYVGRQWSDKNWDVKGDVSEMPDAVCCVFTAKMDHTGLHIGGNQVIHCSVEVKEDTIPGSRAWKKFGIPKGLYTPKELLTMMKGVEFSRMMKKGSRGEDVRRLQLALNVLGYDAGTADGVFGTKTQNAVKAFQRAEGLETDGIAGEKTLEIMAARTAEPDVPELPDEDVDEPQTMLVNMMELMAARDLVAKALNKIDEMLKNGGMVS
jgi:hypothetical protein